MATIIPTRTAGIHGGGTESASTRMAIQFIDGYFSISLINSWNAGIGFETAVADNTTFFIEARYLRIGPKTDRMKFVPIRLGLRF